MVSCLLRQIGPLTPERADCAYPVANGPLRRSLAAKQHIRAAPKRAEALGLLLGVALPLNLGRPVGLLAVWATLDDCSGARAAMLSSHTCVAVET